MQNRGQSNFFGVCHETMKTRVHSDNKKVGGREEQGYSKRGEDGQLGITVWRNIYQK